MSLSLRRDRRRRGCRKQARAHAHQRGYANSLSVHLSDPIRGCDRKICAPAGDVGKVQKCTSEMRSALFTERTNGRRLTLLTSRRNAPSPSLQAFSSSALTREELFAQESCVRRMITPVFQVTQTDAFVVITMRVPHIKVRCERSRLQTPAKDLGFQMSLFLHLISVTGLGDRLLHHGQSVQVLCEAVLPEVRHLCRIPFFSGVFVSEFLCSFSFFSFFSRQCAD